MAYIRKRGNRWRVEVQVGEVRVSDTFDTRKEAATWGAAQEAAAANGKAKRTLGTWTVGEALERFARDVAPNRKGARWEILRCAKLGRDPLLACVQLRALSAPDITAWRDRRLAEVAPASVLREWKLLRSVLEVARKEWHWHHGTPMKDVARPKEAPHRERRVSDDEAERICLALGWAGGAPVNASQRVAIMFRVAIETAMRSGELVALTWDRLDLEAQVATLEMTKNGTRRKVPLSREAVRLLSLLPGRKGSVFGLNDANRDKLFRDGLLRTGIADLRFHDSRHEAVWRLSKKLTMMDLARVTGHTSMKSLMGYYNPTASELAKMLG